MLQPTPPSLPSLSAPSSLPSLPRPYTHLPSQASPPLPLEVGPLKSICTFSGRVVKIFGQCTWRCRPCESFRLMPFDHRTRYTTVTVSYAVWAHVEGSQASCDRMDPLCRQRHLSGYRSRTQWLKCGGGSAPLLPFEPPAIVRAP